MSNASIDGLGSKFCGKVPVRRPFCNVSKRVFPPPMDAIEGGIVPVRLLPGNVSAVSAVNDPIALGIDPCKAVFPKKLADVQP